jgi:hypothetical protein
LVKEFPKFFFYPEGYKLCSQWPFYPNLNTALWHTIVSSIFPKQSLSFRLSHQNAVPYVFLNSQKPSRWNIMKLIIVQFFEISSCSFSFMSQISFATTCSQISTNILPL